jgi:ATP-binding cassette subfamily F protein 3
MLYIKADNIHFKYEEQTETILENIYFHINTNSKIGLIGNNGSGKSTLIKLITKKIKPIVGDIFVKNGLKIGIMNQEIPFRKNETISTFLWKNEGTLYSLHKKIERLEIYNDDEIIEILENYENYGGYQYETMIIKVLQRFGFKEDSLNLEIKKLSGGEKTKLSLSKILLKKPNFIILDEPTNHLDSDSINWLENFLLSINIPFLVVSHDRKFLDSCVKEIWELDKRNLMKYFGNYSLYRDEKSKRLNYKIHQYANQKKKINKLKKAMTVRKKWALNHQGQTGKDGYAPIYESLVNFSKTAMKKAKNLEKRLEMELEKEKSKKPFIEKIRKIKVENSEVKTNYILKVRDLSKSFNKLNLIKNLNFELKFGEKLCIVGKNGSGKSTLLKILTNKLNFNQGKILWSPQAEIGYYSQEFENINIENTIISEITKNSKELEAKARVILGCFNIRNDEVFQKIKDISVGQKSKIAIVKIILSSKNVYILDEPTNHLEISAREALEEALLKYKGCLIFVSHDKYFQNKIATKFLNVETGKIYYDA